MDTFLTWLSFSLILLGVVTVWVFVTLLVCWAIQDWMGR